MAGSRDLVIETIEDPDFLVTGRKGEILALRYYQAPPISAKNVVAVYREIGSDGFLITAFMTSAPEAILRKGVLWQSPQTS